MHEPLLIFKLLIQTDDHRAIIVYTAETDKTGTANGGLP